MKIFEYQFTIKQEPSVEIHEGAQILHVGVQDGMATLWALVEPSNPKISYGLRVYGTGHECPGSEGYIGTIQMPPFVWHVFE